MTDIIVTAIITALATTLIMMMAIAAAAVNEDDKKYNNKEIEELKRKITTLEIRVEAMLTVMNSRGKTLYNLGLKDKELEEKIKKLEKEKTTKKK